MARFLKILLILALGLGAVCLGESAPPDSEPTVVPAPAAESEKSPHSWAPLAGYNPTYKVFFGGGYFYDNGPFTFSTVGVLTFEKVYQLIFKFRHRVASRLSYLINPEFARGFDPYYGEGGTTRVQDLTKIFATKVLFKPTFEFAITKNVSVGFFFDIRNRAETPNQGPGAAPSRLFPDETTMAVGTYFQSDFRDDPDEATTGYLLRIEVERVPSGMSSVNSDSFGQVEGTLSLYCALIPGVKVIAASSLRAGISSGNPTYLFRYRLGGGSRLRGYLENRFRGDKYYLQQNELRFPIWKMFNGVAFLGFGDATDGEFSQPKLIYGGGLRLGLPPDWITKARIDIGWGKDQNGVFVDFGQVF